MNPALPPATNPPATPLEPLTSAQVAGLDDPAELTRQAGSPLFVEAAGQPNSMDLFAMLGTQMLLGGVMLFLVGLMRGQAPAKTCVDLGFELVLRASGYSPSQSGLPKLRRAMPVRWSCPPAFAPLEARPERGC